MTEKVKTNYVDHVSIAVKSLVEAEKDFVEAFGWEVSGRYIDSNEGIRVSYFMIGQTALELVEDLDGTGELAQYIDKHGEGVIVISFNVDQCSEALKTLQRNGAKVVDQEPRYGSEIKRYFAFLHPKYYHGVMPEIIDGRH